MQEPTLFAPDLLIHNLPTAWQYLQWIELGLGVWILMGLWIRVAAFVLSLLIILSLMLYGTSMMYYCGFYFAISFFLLINGGGEYSVYPKKIRFNPHSLIIAQYLTGLNFIYSAIVVKWFAPAVDIYLLEKTKAFTFGLAYDTFVFIMLITEILFGLLLILGRQLRVVSIILLSLFIFLSFNLSENLFSHSFIYGLLSVFIILEGYPQKIFTTR